jgi:uncharacterized membrane protein
MQTWVIQALIATIGFTVVALVFKKLASDGASSGTINMYFFLMVFVGLVIYNIAAGESFKADYKFFLLLLAAAVLAVFTNIYHIKSLHSAPNPGYTRAIVAFNAVLVAIISVFLFQSKLTLIKGLGIVLAIIGIILVSL